MLRVARDYVAGSKHTLRLVVVLHCTLHPFALLTGHACHVTLHSQLWLLHINPPGPHARCATQTPHTHAPVYRLGRYPSLLALAQSQNIWPV
jgi:hypothetical protein